MQPDKAAQLAAQRLVDHVIEHGISERAACAAAEIDRRTWRRGTGRPYPCDNGGESRLSLRDFIAFAQTLRLDPADVLRDALAGLSRPPRPYPLPPRRIDPARKSKQQLRQEAEKAVKDFAAQ